MEVDLVSGSSERLNLKEQAEEQFLQDGVTVFEKYLPLSQLWLGLWYFQKHFI